MAVRTSLRTHALGMIRRGPRTVLWTEPHLGLGNFMYHWLQAFRRREAGEDVVVLRTAEMEPWLPYFPSIGAQLTVSRSDVRPRDRRSTGFFQGWGSDYWPEHVERFVRLALDDTTLPLIRGEDGNRIVVNVRRGDYFGPQFAHRFAFPQGSYLGVALARAVATGGPARSIHVVSDEIAWCRTNLMWLADSAELTFAAPEPTPVHDFITLATARRLILTNSTFGYWAAHFANAIHGDNHQDVVVPWFHDRTIWAGASYHLNPAWTVVRDIPGGWDGDAR